MILRSSSTAACINGTKHHSQRGSSCAVQAVQSKLRALGVRRLVVQSVRSLLPMWLGSLGFLPLTLAEADALDPLLVSPDPDSAQLIKKTLIPRYLLYSVSLKSVRCMSQTRAATAGSFA